MNNSELLVWLSDVERLPVLPQDVHRLVKVLADDSLDYKRLSEVLQAHQSISSRILVLANSAWINTGREVTSVEQACFKLGLNIVRSVSIGLAVMKPFNIAFCPAFDLKRYWATSMLVACGAEMLASQMPEAEQDPNYVKTVQTAGILHNIGLLCLADIKPQETHNALRVKSNNPQITLIDVFRHEIRTDYCEVGGFLTSSWGIPESLVACIRYHRDPEYSGPYHRLSMLIGIAANWAGLLFRSEPRLASAFLEQQAIGLSQQEAVFGKLKERFQNTYELAATLFH